MVDVESPGSNCPTPPPPNKECVLLSDCSDACGDFGVRHGDILEARICNDASGANYIFWMFTREAVPTQPDIYTAFIWLLDTDMDEQTGHPLGDAGSDFHVRVAYSPGDQWKGFIDVTWGGIGGTGPVGTVSVVANTVQLVVPKSSFEGFAPPAPGRVFRWVATTIAADMGQGDRAPDHPSAVVAQDTEPGVPRVSFDQADYLAGDTLTITVTDEKYEGAAQISSTDNVLVLRDNNNAQLAAWTSLPVVPGKATEFCVSFVLPSGLPEGSLTSTYTDPGAPERSASAVSSVSSQPPQVYSPPYYVFPPNLHLTPGATSSVPLSVIDRYGKTVSSANIVFDRYDGSLISISKDGYVTALRAESSTEIGTWVSAHVDGMRVESTAVVRVLSRSCGTEFVWVEGQNTALYYPANASGEDITTYVDRYEILKANEWAYLIQQELMDIEPFGGALQIFAVDFGEGEQQRVCGISGNPIRLGWNLSGETWQNCFLMLNLTPVLPQWGVFYHELGHNFTFASSTFNQALDVALYIEGIATALGLSTIARIIEDQAAYPLRGTTVASLQDLLERDENMFLDNLECWIGNGAIFSSLDPNIVDGIWLHYRNQRPGDFAARFFRPLQPRYSSQVAPILNQMNTGEQHTVFAALVSAAAGTDLSSIFMGTYNYPVNMPLFQIAYDIFTNIVDG